MSGGSRQEAIARRLIDRAVMDGRLDELVDLPGPPLSKRMEDAANSVKGGMLRFGPLRWLNDLRKGTRR